MRIAYLLLNHLALRRPAAKAKPNAKTELRLPSIPQLQQHLRGWLWNQVIDNLEGGKRTQATARKLKELIQT